MSIDFILPDMSVLGYVVWGFCLAVGFMFVREIVLLLRLCKLQEKYCSDLVQIEVNCPFFSRVTMYIIILGYAQGRHRTMNLWV